MTLSDSVDAGITKLGSRDLEPIAFFIVKGFESGPITAISGTSLSRMTGTADLLSELISTLQRHRAKAQRFGPPTLGLRIIADKRSFVLRQGQCFGGKVDGPDQLL